VKEISFDAGNDMKWKIALDPRSGELTIALVPSSSSRERGAFEKTQEFLAIDFDDIDEHELLPSGLVTFLVEHGIDLANSSYQLIVLKAWVEERRQISNQRQTATQ
jgi:hypothetical protein